ncbi:lysoplasmalogenase [Nostocoides sp. F2B08]|uniref:lysoplasmalogenase n=1 Tax=Nostocoides sp. F2B08 TaxID=2653936 RepID=UPI00186AFDCE|nr:lysoplasmalogenase [Tetrasphaera sp. F2B08]
MLILAWSAVVVAAVVNWWGVATGTRSAVVGAKPLTLVALIGVAGLAGAGESISGRWLLVGLVLCLAGDVFLLGDGESAFLAGLSAFLLGHLAYVVSFVALGLAEPAWGLIGLMALIAVLLATRRVIPAAYREGGAVLAGAVAAYMVVIGAMVVTAWMTGEWLIGLGAMTFMVSDAILAVARFVRSARHADLAVMVTYHVGQVLIVIGVLSALRLSVL